MRTVGDGAFDAGRMLCRLALDALRMKLGRALETGALQGPVARQLATVWARQARVVRSLSWSESLWTVGIGGATLGGSGKTALALELARRAPRSERIYVLTRSYPERVSAPRRVLCDDEPERVGDEAVMLARALAPSSVEVWVGSWQPALDALAARGRGVVILDGVLQARPRRLDCSVLSLEAAAPWGAGHCPPAGDLIASSKVLLEAADLVVWRSSDRSVKRSLDNSGAPFPSLPGVTRPPTYDWTQTLVGARGPCGRWVPVERLAELRLGLLLAIGRPDRVARELAAHGVHPLRVLLRADHGRFPAAFSDNGPPLDAWLTTAKCATKLESYYGGVPVWILEQAGGLPESLVARCFGRASLGASEAC